MREKPFCLVLCHDGRLNEVLKVIFESDGYEIRVQNTIPGALRWYLHNTSRLPKGFQVVLVTVDGQGAEFWELFLSIIPSQHLPPVEVAL